MEFWENASWASMGAYYTIDAGLRSRRSKAEMKQIERIKNALTDVELEDKIRTLIYHTRDQESFVKIWEEIEEYKRDNYHKIIEHSGTSYWASVGKERYPFTEQQYLLETGKRKLSKEDMSVLAMYRGRVITLLMNTKGKYSLMEATRCAYLQVCGDTASWTLQYG